MNAQLRILSWSAKGFRCPDHEIDLRAEDGQPAPVCLVQMPNGTGKTTTLQLLRAALSGEATTWTEAEVRKLRKQNLAESAQPFGLFELRAIVDGSLLTVQLHTDFEDGSAYYETTDLNGKKAGFKAPPQLKTILRPDFVKFFVFDGELAEELLDGGQTKAEGVIDSLFRLDLFEDLRARTNEYYEQELTKRGGGAIERGPARHRNQLEKLRRRLDQLTQEKAARLEEIARMKDRILKLDNQHRVAIEARTEYRDRLEKTGESQARTRNAVRVKADKLLNDMRSPQALSAVLAGEMLALMQSLDRVKLPESTAREFFEELAHEAECVCGRPLDAERQKVIRSRAKLYLGSEEMNLLNSLKASVKEAVGPEPQASRVRIDSQVSDLRGVLKERKQAEIDHHEVQQEAADSDPEIAKVQAELLNLRKEMEQKTLEVARYDETTGRHCDETSCSIPDLDKACKAKEARIVEIAKAKQLHDQHEILKGILKHAKTHAGRLLKEEVCDRTNLRIEQLMPQNRLRVRGIEGCLQLHNPDSNRRQQGGSVGENLAVAYAFLSTLFSRSEQHDLPFVVDSPAGPLDGAKRRQVAQLVPKLSGQFIAFTINTEQEAFVEPLEEATRAVGKGVPVYRTLFRRGAHPTAETEGVVTSDGHLVAGRDFFVTFREPATQKEEA